jgi:hypothetical protein
MFGTEARDVLDIPEIGGDFIIKRFRIFWDTAMIS